MSKFKDSLLRKQEEQMMYMGNFLDYIYSSVNAIELSNEDINYMEEDFRKTSTVSDVIVSPSSLKAVNNPYYKENEGA